MTILSLTITCRQCFLMVVIIVSWCSVVIGFPVRQYTDVMSSMKAPVRLGRNVFAITPDNVFGLWEASSRFETKVSSSKGMDVVSGLISRSRNVTATAIPRRIDIDASRPSEAEITKICQEAACSIVKSFIPTTFQPLFTDRHIQTIGGFVLRDSCAYLPTDPVDALVVALRLVGRIIATNFSHNFHRIVPTSSVSSSTNIRKTFYWDKRQRIDAPDGDWFHVDIKYSRCNDRTNRSDNSVNNAPVPMVLMCHGLESNSASSLTQHLAEACCQEYNMDFTCLNFRGCSIDPTTGQPIPNDRLGGYHLGYTDDLVYYLQHLKHNRGSLSSSNAPIYLMGFSLGANVILKCLGDLGVSAMSDYNIQGAAALCAPLDQCANALILGKPGGINRFIYTNNLLQKLKQRAQEQLDLFCNSDPTTNVFDYPRTMAATTITELDDAFVAPVYGFDDCWDYYRQTSSINVLDRIVVPTMILNAVDDPFFDPNVWPIEKSVEYGGSAPLKMIRSPHGGHLGFCFHRQGKDETDVYEKGHIKPFWAAREVARFLNHIRQQVDYGGCD